MRLRAAIEPLASTRKRIRFPSLPSLTFSRRSVGRTTRPEPSRPRALWWGAAARTVAASAMSLGLPPLSCPRPHLRGLAVRRAPILACSGRGRSAAGTIRWIRVFREGILEFLGVYARLLEGSASAAVREGQQGGPPHVVENDPVPGVPGG